MSEKIIAALVAGSPVIIAAVVAGAVSLLVTLITIRREALKENRQRQASARDKLDTYRAPLLAAVDDLGWRINNIRHNNFLAYLSVEDRSEEAVLSTLFRFAQYLAWTEIVHGYADRLRFESNEATKEVADSIGNIAWILAGDRFDRTDEADFRTSQLMLWGDEQRAIGELMRSTDGTPLGFNSFTERYETEKDSGFAKWFRSFAAQLRNESAPRTDRLTELQQVLAWLAQQLDGDHVLFKRDDNGKVVPPRWAQPEMIGPQTRWTDPKFVSSRPSGTSQLPRG
jgi:hypothetical protein